MTFRGTPSQAPGQKPVNGLTFFVGRIRLPLTWQ